MRISVNLPEAERDSTRPSDRTPRTPRATLPELAPARVHRIAVVRALQLGDLLAAVPALRAVRRRYPRAEITLIGLPWAAAFASRYSAYVDRFLTFPGWPGIIECEYDQRRTDAFVREQRDYGYDLALQMHGSGGASNPFTLALGARVTAGYYEGTPPAGLTLAAPYPDDQPEPLRQLWLARLVGCRSLSPRPEFPLTPADEAEARALLGPLEGDADDADDVDDAGPGAPMIGVHVGARPPSRRWAPERFASLADALVERHGARIALTGGPDEADLIAATQRHMRFPSVSLAGKTSLGGLAAVLARLTLFVSNDTGAAHVAYAVGTPSVTIFGPADVRRWAPLGASRHAIVRVPVECSPCSYWECPIDHRCLGRVTPDLVLAACDRVMRATSRRSSSRPHPPLEWSVGLAEAAGAGETRRPEHMTPKGATA